MGRLSFNLHCSPADVIRHAVWLCFSFTLSFRDIEQLLAQCGIGASCKTLRCRTIEFGPQIAAKLRHRGAAPWPRHCARRAAARRAVTRPRPTLQPTN
jgi:putative transposase